MKLGQQKIAVSILTYTRISNQFPFIFSPALSLHFALSPPSLPPYLHSPPIYIGAVYFNDCPGRSRIPIWLIVFGGFSIVQTFINVIKRCCKLCRKQEGDSDSDDGGSNYGNRGGSCFETLVSIFLFVWIIVGSVWIFGFYPEYRECTNEPALSNECCHSVPYLFSFVTLIVIYAVSFLSLFCCCCCFVCMAFLVGASGGE